MSARGQSTTDKVGYSVRLQYLNVPFCKRIDDNDDDAVDDDCDDNGDDDDDDDNGDNDDNLLKIRCPIAILRT